MQEASLCVPTKLWALLCATLAASLSSGAGLMLLPSLLALCYLATQKSWKQARAFGLFFLLLAALLLLIRYRGLKMIIFSQFHVLLFWNLFPVFVVGWDLMTTPPGALSAFLSRLRTPTPVILGLLVIFRFFPTMKSEARGVLQSMRNRGLTAPAQALRHPALTCEYVLVPVMLRCVQIADQLSISAVARGAEAPGVRGSYYRQAARARDYAWAAAWTVGTLASLALGRIL